LYTYGKRILDVVVASLAIVLLSPVLAIVYILSRVKLGKPVLFKQLRPGMHGELFTMIKFRTMTNGRDAQDELLPDAMRMTKWGSFLRASSLDELPELWNVLKGEMSLVGPRPLLVEYLPLYSKEQVRRHEVRPGITGLAQVNGRNAISWDEKFALDIDYVNSRTFSLDVKIILQTFANLIRKSDISAPGEATMPTFKGNVSA
jgi:lipopolysaccharide/colanic/teichoic acid biosynthesis glycosyltransferase